MTDDKTLIQLAKAGSDEALGTLFGRYGNRLMALIRLRMGPKLRRRLESRDVLQQTLLKAYERLEQFDGGGETSLMGWLGAIAQNEIRDCARFHRRAGRDFARDVPLEAATQRAAEQLRTEISRLHWQQQAQALEIAMESLRPEHREILILRRFEELSYPEIGKRLKKSADACRMLYSRAMASLTLRLSERVEHSRVERSRVEHSREALAS